MTSKPIVYISTSQVKDAVSGSNAGNHAVILDLCGTMSAGSEAFTWDAVALDGNRVLIDGAVPDPNRPNYNLIVSYLFDISGNLLRTFDFGNFLTALALDGNHVLLGDSGNDTLGDNVGQAYLNDATTGDLLLMFDDPTPTSGGFGVGDWFGEAGALDGNFVLIGARRDDTHGENVGQAHLFGATTGALLQTFDDPTVTDHDHFGKSVALDGNRVLISAWLDDTIGEDVGQVHLFTAMPELAADFDSDGNADGNDFLVWQRGESPDSMSATDLALWEANYGTNAPLTTTSSTVPEPSAWMLCAFGLTCLSLIRR